MDKYRFRKKYSLAVSAILYIFVALPMDWINEQTFSTLLLFILAMFKAADVAEKKVLR